MSIYKLQQPERLTPSNLEMVYTLRSNNNGNTNFKYVVDVYFKPYEDGLYPLPTTSEKVARLKVRPNKEGNAIIDIQEIVSNLLTPNIRKDYEEPIGQQYFSMFVGGNNGYDSFFVTKPTLYLGYSQSNGNNHITDFEEQDHFNEFRILVGEEYDDINGDKVLIIPTEVNKPHSSFYVLRGIYPASWTGADYNAVSIYDAGIEYPSGAERGYNVTLYTDNTETTIVETITTTDYDGFFVPTSAPTTVVRLVVTETYSGIQRVFDWDTSPGEGRDNVVGFTYTESRYPTPYGDLDASLSPPSFYSWVSTVRREDRLQRKDLISSISTLEDNLYGRGNHLFNWRPYYIPYQPTTRTPRAEIGWLGPMPYKVSTNDTLPYGYDNYEYNFEKKWYPGQPIMLSFFNSYCNEFVNQVRAIVRTIVYKTGFIEYQVVYNTKANGGGPLVNYNDTYPSIEGQEIENRLTTFTDNQVNTLDKQTYQGGIKDIYYHIVTDLDLFNLSEEYTYNGNTPYYHFTPQELGCFEDNPIYFVYLNPLGAWDTLTFGKKNTKTYTKSTKTYQQGKYRQGAEYSRLSYERKTNIYDQTTTISVECNSDYITEEESKYVEDLVLSPYVYIVEPMSADGGDTISSNTTLIPVNITTNSVDEYKKNYQKLRQYTLTFEYDNINGYPVQL